MRILREPLLHFFVLGALVFVAARHFDGESGRYRIDAGPAQRARLEATYVQQYGVTPTPEQLQVLLDQFVRSEILFREGLAMGLDRDDEIVRRRVVQKIEFVNQDLDPEAEPSDASLVGYFEHHKGRYSEPPAVSFSHLYFSADRGGEANAKARAERALGELENSELVRGNARALASADPFAEGVDFTLVSSRNAATLFGDSQLSAALLSAPVGKWSGPYQSGFGWHLLRVTERAPQRAADFQTVRSRVKADYLADLRDRRNDEEFRRLASKYHIVTDGAPT